MKVEGSCHLMENKEEDRERQEKRKEETEERRKETQRKKIVSHESHVM